MTVRVQSLRNLIPDQRHYPSSIHWVSIFATRRGRRVSCGCH
jgi:hypothetical protein